MLEKGHGAADWSVRPLTAAQLRYAALDVELLPELRDAMAAGARRGRQDRDRRAGVRRAARRSRRASGARTSGGAPRASTASASPAPWPSCARCGTPATRSPSGATSRSGGSSPTASIAAAAQATLTSMDDLAAAEGVQRPRCPALPEPVVGGHQRGPAAARSRTCPPRRVPPTGPPPPRSWADRDPAAFARLSAARTRPRRHRRGPRPAGREPPVPRHRPAPVLVAARAGRPRTPSAPCLLAAGRPAVAGRRDGRRPCARRSWPGRPTGYWRVASVVTGR